MAEIRKIRKIRAILPSVAVKLRTAAYARVSFETDQMHHSLEAQVSYYSQLIQSHSDWEFVGIYADEGITGTSTKNRSDFNRLVADCEAGLIDLVLVKSISRFARDTIDTLKTTRHLKELGIDVYFERERIHSMSDDGELLLTLLASFAQEESRSISQNVKWAIRKKFEQGIPNGYKAPYGYEWNGEEFSIIPEEAKVVRHIFEMYLSKVPAYRIAKKLREQGIVGQTGVPLNESTIKDIVTSTSYAGLMILQKNYFTETKARKKNRGELPRYAVEGMFEPIVDMETVEQAIAIREERASKATNRNPTITAFSGKVKCGNCGASVSRRTAKGNRTWKCNTSERKGKKECDMRRLSETELENAVTKVLGLDAFDEDIARTQIAIITVFGDRLEFKLQNGKIKIVQRIYGGYKSRNGFSGKIRCGICGNICERNTWKMGPADHKVAYGLWKCKSPRCECSLKRVMENELRYAAKSIIGSNDYEPRIVEEILSIVIDNHSLRFQFKEGREIEWQRK